MNTRRSLGLMNLAVLSAMVTGLYWGWAFDDAALKQDSSFNFFAGLLFANVTCVFNWLAWKPALLKAHGVEVTES